MFPKQTKSTEIGAAWLVAAELFMEAMTRVPAVFWTSTAGRQTRNQVALQYHLLKDTGTRGAGPSASV